MAANIRTFGLSGLARALVQHGRLRDAEAERLTQETKAANSSFIERLIASGRMGTPEARAPATRAVSRSSRSCRFPTKSSVLSCVGATRSRSRSRRTGVRDLRQAGLLKVKQGLTSLEEVMAVTNE